MKPHNKVALRFSDLSPPRQALVRLCQWLNFGQIQRMQVRDGNPVFAPVPFVRVDKNLNADVGARPEFHLEDFELRNEVRRLMDTIDELKNGVIERIDVRAGVPCRIIFESRLPELR